VFINCYHVSQVIDRNIPILKFYENVEVTHLYLHNITQTHSTLRIRCRASISPSCAKLLLDIHYRMRDASRCFGFGPSTRKRYIMIAPAPGLSLPSWPVPTHGIDDPNVRHRTTLCDNIEDLEWRIPSKYNDTRTRLASAFLCQISLPRLLPAHMHKVYLLKGKESLTHRATGWS